MVRATPRYLVFALLGLLGATPASTQQRPATARANIVILKSRNLEQFNLAIDGFRRGLQQSRVPFQITELSLADGVRQLPGRIAQLRPDLIVPFGSTATTFAREQFPNVPIVFAMVLYPAQSGISTVRPNITGISMDIPILRQFEAIRDVVPKARRIGVLYNPKETGNIIDEAREVARELGMDLVPIAVDSERSVPSSIQGVERKIDVLWSVADSTVFTPTTTEFIILYTLQHNLPFMGLSAGFADGGALFALGQDFSDMGREAAESAIRVLAGTPAGALPITTPRKTALIVNSRVADEIGVRIPDDAMKKAVRVIR